MRAAIFFYMCGEMAGGETVQEQKEKKRHRVVVDCNNRSCDLQFKGECRADHIKREDGRFVCPFGHIEKLQKDAPHYGERNKRMRGARDVPERWGP